MYKSTEDVQRKTGNMLRLVSVQNDVPVRWGRLKTREWKMRYGQNSKGGKCRSKPYGTPIREYIEKALSYFVILVLILLTE